MRRAEAAVFLIVAAAALAGCTHANTNDPRIHLSTFGVDKPDGNTVMVCHAYTCKMKTPYRFSKANLKAVAAEMNKTKRNGSTFEERRAISYAIALMERQVASKTGIKSSGGMDLTKSGQRKEQDCVDNAMNTTSYLIVLERNGLIKQHTVRGHISKGNILKGALEGEPIKYWPHWAAVIEERKTGQRDAVDSSVTGTGDNPAILKTEDWFLPDRPQTDQGTS